MGYVRPTQQGASVHALAGRWSSDATSAMRSDACSPWSLGAFYVSTLSEDGRYFRGTPLADDVRRSLVGSQTEVNRLTQFALARPLSLHALLGHVIASRDAFDAGDTPAIAGKSS